MTTLDQRDRVSLGDEMEWHVIMSHELVSMVIVHNPCQHFGTNVYNVDWSWDGEEVDNQGSSPFLESKPFDIHVANLLCWFVVVCNKDCCFLVNVDGHWF